MFMYFCILFIIFVYPVYIKTTYNHSNQYPPPTLSPLSLSHFYSLYEQEAKRRDKLMTKLDRSREVAATSRQQLRYLYIDT